jgi:hypothetical protein
MSKKEDQKQGTFIHGIAASEHLDSSGERINVKGIDITSLTKDGVFNFEHQSKEASSIVGKITQAKKILKESDCDNDRHKYFSKKIKKPYVYVAGELFDADGHQAAKDVVAMLKYDNRNKEDKDSKKLINFSIEGQKVESDGPKITQSIARKVSITITPCNKVCEAELLDPKDIENGEKMKKFGDNEDNFSFIQDLMSKTEGHFASCEPMEKDEFNQSKPDTGYGKIIDTTPKPKESYGKIIEVGNKPKKEGYGKVIGVGNKPKEGFGKVMVKTDKKVTMTAKEAVEEHEHLVDVLDSKSHKDDKKESKKQKKELKQYKKKLKKNDEEEIPWPLGNPEDRPKKKVVKDLEKDDSPEQLYHIRHEGNRITNKPQSLKQINEVHGNTKDLESKGFRLVHHNPPLKPMGKTEEIIQKFEFFNRIANKFNQHMKRKAIDRTANRMQAERETQGKEFDPDATVIAGPKKTTIGAGKNPEFKGQPYVPPNRTRFLFPSDDDLLNPKTKFAPERSPIEAGKLKADIDATLEARSKKKEMNTFQEEEKKRWANKPRAIDADTEVVKSNHSRQNNMRKALMAGSGMGAPSTKTQGEALQGEYIDSPKKKKKKGDKEIVVEGDDNQLSSFDTSKMFSKSEKLQALKIMSDEAFSQFEKKEELLDFLVDSLPNTSAEELMALAKTVAYVSVKKKEIKLESLLKSRNVREQKKKVFGTNPRPKKGSPQDLKHMRQIESFAKDFFGLDLKPSGGKMNPKTGQRKIYKDKKTGKPRAVRQGIEKPDWRSGQLESQSNPDAAVHELAHLILMPKGVGLEDAQRLMDDQYKESKSKFGYAKQDRTKWEYEPRGVEQILKRVMGLPASKKAAKVKEGAPLRTAMEDPNKVIGHRTIQGATRDGEPKHVDLMNLAQNISPESRVLVERRLNREEIFHHEKGWMDNPTINTKINQRDTSQQDMLEQASNTDELVKKSEILAKAKVYDLTSKKMIGDTDRGDNAQSIVENQSRPKNIARFADNEQKVARNSNVKQILGGIKHENKDPYEDMHPADRAHQLISARFASNTPKSLISAIENAKQGGHDEPYAFGDIHSVVHGTIRDGKKEQHWNNPMPMPMKVKDVQGHLGKRVAQGGSDPFMWMDQKYGLSKDVLKNHRNKPLKISTRSDLIAQDDYMKHLDPKKHSVEIHVFGDNERQNRQMEPGAPSFSRRMKAAQKLRAAGIPVTIVHDKIEGVPEDLDFNKFFDMKTNNQFAIKENIIKPNQRMIQDISRATGMNFGKLLRKKR